MLVLSRQRDESIMIGEDIEVTVVDIRGDKVRLGVTALREITVHRKEVYEAIKREARVGTAVEIKQGGHLLDRTSPVGHDFRGKCRYCGRENLPPKAALEPCDKAPSGILDAINPPG